MDVSPEEDLNSSLVGKDLLENQMEMGLENDLNFSPVMENLLEK